MSKRLVEDAQGWELARVDAVAAIKRDPDDGHARIALAYIEARGCRLTAAQVDGLVGGDEAIAAACHSILTGRSNDN